MRRNIKLEMHSDKIPRLAMHCRHSSETMHALNISKTAKNQLAEDNIKTPYIKDANKTDNQGE